MSQKNCIQQFFLNILWVKRTKYSPILQFNLRFALKILFIAIGTPRVINPNLLQTNLKSQIRVICLWINALNYTDKQTKWGIILTRVYSTHYAKLKLRRLMDKLGSGPTHLDLHGYGWILNKGILRDCFESEKYIFIWMLLYLSFNLN